MNVLPFAVHLIAATILGKQNNALIAEAADLRAEIAYLRAQLPMNTRLRFTDRWRKKLARAAGHVSWKRLTEITTVAKASTIRDWYRLMRKDKLGIKKGRTRKAADHRRSTAGGHPNGQ